MKKLMPLLLIILLGCNKESIHPGDRASILDFLDPQYPYTYGYIARGTPTYFSDSTGHTYGIAYRFELYTDSIYFIGDDITGKLGLEDSTVTLDEIIINL